MLNKTNKSEETKVHLILVLKKTNMNKFLKYRLPCAIPGSECLFVLITLGKCRFLILKDVDSNGLNLY